MQDTLRQGFSMLSAGRLEEAHAAFKDAQAIHKGDQMTNLNIQRLNRMIRQRKNAAGN